MKKIKNKLMPTYGNILLVGSMHATTKEARTLCALAWQLYTGDQLWAKGRYEFRDLKDLMFRTEPDSPFKGRMLGKFDDIVKDCYTTEIRITPQITVCISGTSKYIRNKDKAVSRDYLGNVTYETMGTIIRPMIYIVTRDVGYEGISWGCHYHRSAPVLGFSKLKKYIKSIRRETKDLLEYPYSSERFFMPEAYYQHRLKQNEGKMAERFEYCRTGAHARIETNRIGRVTLYRFRDEPDEDYKQPLSPKTDYVDTVHNATVSVPFTGLANPYKAAIHCDADGRFPDYVENNFR